MRAFVYGLLGGLVAVAIVACGSPVATPVPTAVPTATRAPAPTVNPTVLARLTATRQRQADAGADACQRLDAEFARYSASFDHHQDPNLTLQELAYLSGYDVNAHTTGTDAFVRYTLGLARSCQDS
jgi:hypothetical protein